MSVIDADGHLMEPRSMWDEYMPDGYRDRRPRVVVENGGTERLMVDGVVVPQVRGKGSGRPEGLVFEGRPAGAADPRARLDDMEVEGIDVSVLFPTQLLCLGAAHDPGLAQAMCRAYNDWVTDYASVDPGRLRPVATISLLDVDAAVVELRRCVEELGMVGGWISTNVGGKDLDHPDFAPYFAEHERLDVPVMIHPGPALGTPAAGVDRFDNFFYAHSIGFPFEAMIAVMTMVCGGVLSRHPRLRAVFLESGVGWLPYWLDRLDEHFEARPENVPDLKVPPSEVIRSDQFFISCDPGEPTVPYVVESVGAERIVFASDYAHWDSKFPKAVEAFRSTEGLAEVDAVTILEDSPGRLFGPRFAAVPVA